MIYFDTSYIVRLVSRVAKTYAALPQAVYLRTAENGFREIYSISINHRLWRWLWT